MQALGRQVLLELYDCDAEALSDEALLREAFLDAARLAGATVVTDVFHRFSPYGVSGVVVIAESHLSVHTWPEHGYAAVDLFTCGHVDPWEIEAALRKVLRPGSVSMVELRRGMVSAHNTKGVEGQSTV